jgi:hypothetical protein
LSGFTKFKMAIFYFVLDFILTPCGDKEFLIRKLVYLLVYCTQSLFTVQFHDQ